MRKRVFISYRRTQAKAAAERGAAYLRRILPDEHVFLDTSSIQGGAQFFQKLQKSVDQSDIVFVLIGPDWAQVRNESNRPRLEDPTDFVRIEVERALFNGKTLVPILLHGARMPDASALPPSVRPIVSRQAIATDDGTIEGCLDRAIKELEIATLPLDRLVETLKKYHTIAEWHPNLRAKAGQISQWCNLFPYEQIAGLIDLTISGDGRHFLAFTTAGLYHRSIGTDRSCSFRSYGRITSVGLDERTSTLLVDHEGWNITGTMEDEAAELVHEIVQLFR